MKVIGLDGRPFHLDLSGKINQTTTDKSKPHLEARTLLQKLFPLAPLAEEIYVPGLRIYLDFLLPTYKLAIEVDGEQHRSHVSFFHKTELDFLRSNLRDRTKDEWCYVNGISLARLPDNDPDSWRALILGASVRRPDPG